MNEIKVIIDGKECIGYDTDTVLEIAKKNDVYIPTLCHSENTKLYGACGVCLCEIEGVPKLQRACSVKVKDGQIVSTKTERVKQARKIALELLMSDHRGDCIGPCKLNCPAGTDVQGYIKLISEGKYHEAVKLIKETNPLPASIGRVCPHPCESACRRRLIESAMSIAYLKAYAADKDLEKDTYVPNISDKTGKKVAVIGGGPGGLTSAFFLRLKGHEVTVFDMQPKMGGMLRYGIPSYRLPKDVLDAEIKEIEKLGVVLKNNVKIGSDITLNTLKNEYDAVIVAIGAWASSSMRCKGEELKGVIGGIKLLEEVALGNRPNLGNNVAVVGGGNTAMDACRTAVRLGAKNVYVVYRRDIKSMPAEEIEIKEAMEEGVIFKTLVSPMEIVGENGKCNEIKLQVMELGEPDISGRRRPVPIEGKIETLKVDSVISAIGQKVNIVGFEELELNDRDIIKTDNLFKTNIDKVFAIGDATNKGASIAISAIGEGEKAAKVVDAFLSGYDVEKCDGITSKKANLAGYRNSTGFISINEESDEFVSNLKDEFEISSRIEMAVRKANDRKKDFNYINLGFKEDDVIKEAKRCLECGCHDYGHCSLIKVANIDEINPERLRGEHHPQFKETRLLSIERDQGKCITCNLCVRTCDEVANKGILGLVGRGFTTVIKPEFNNVETIAVCKTCNECANACPTGALKIL